MTITTTPLGANSGVIYFTAGETRINVMNAVAAWLITKGWEAFGPGAPNDLRVFRSLNKDGVTYKFLVLDNATTNQLRVMGYESWNPITHAGINMCFGSDNVGTACAMLAMNAATGGWVYMWAKSTYAIFQTRVVGQTLFNVGSPGNSPVGLVEMTRDTPEDTPTFDTGGGSVNLPCWAWLNFSSLLTYGNHGYAFSMPRVMQGGIGMEASRCNASAMLGGSMRTSNGVTGSASAILYQCGLLRDVPDAYGTHVGRLNPWSNKPEAFTLWARNLHPQFGFGALRGRFHGIKMFTQGKGTMFDTVNLKVDTEGFLDPAGTVTENNTLLSFNPSQTSLICLPT